MTGEVLVEVEKISKKLCRDLKRSLWYGLQDLGREISAGTQHDRLRPKEFWAVQDVSFHLHRGEVLGLIGPNGAGKSTLLRMLNGLIKPDRGLIRIRGQVGALIALGMGFNPILTGKENVYNAGAVLGFSKQDIDAKYDAIVDFAGLEEFMGSPVKNFSTGMKVRLGFAIATQTEPDVLLLDEVLAVGDTAFKIKCYNRIQELAVDTCTILVSHSMPQIGKVASKVIVMDKGFVVDQTCDVPAGILRYLSMGSTKEQTVISQSEKICVSELSVRDGNGNKPLALSPEDGLLIRFDAVIDKTVREYILSIKVVSHDQTNVYEFNSRADGRCFANDGNRICIEMETGSLRLNAGQYSLRMDVLNAETLEVLFKQNNIETFTATGSFIGFGFLVGAGKWRVGSTATETSGRKHTVAAT